MSITLGELGAKFLAAAGKADALMEKKLETLVKAGTGVMKREIQAMHAVDTGAMLNSTTAERVGKGTYLVGPTVRYAPYVALGTSRMAARPFHISAARKMEDLAPKVMALSAKDLGL